MNLLHACLLSLAAASSPAQLAYLWSFEDLYTKADVVVIARHAETIDTGRAAGHPELTPPFPVIEQRTLLNVLAVLKPAAARSPAPGAGAPLTLKHYRKDWGRWKTEHGAQPGSPPPGVVNTGEVLEFTEPGPYLLFLVKSPDGVSYEPLSGHTWPGRSVYLLRELQRPPR